MDGCPHCCEMNQVIPQHTDNRKKGDKEIKGTVKACNFYAKTLQKVAQFENNGYKVFQMWEYEWKQYCKQHKLNPQGSTRNTP